MGFRCVPHSLAVFGLFMLLEHCWSVVGKVSRRAALRVEDALHVKKIHIHPALGSKSHML